jgi:hypothetical protein
MSRVWYDNTIIPSRYIVNPINAKIEPSVSNVANDAFGRLRISEPFTLFDSSHRYADNGLWATEVVSIQMKVLLI